MKRIARRGCVLIALFAVVAFLLTTASVSATVQGGPALQLPWPSGVQHNINGGSTYNCPPYHNTTPANNYPYYDNADYYAIDFALNYELVTASASGTVRFSGEVSNDGYGQKIEIDHPGSGSYFSIYAHLSERYVGQGAVVSQGQVIGKSGQSGGSYDPHLHFQLQSGVNAAIPEPLSGVSDFGQYCLAVSPSWMSRPPWQPEYSYEPWLFGTWGSESLTAAAVDRSQAKFVVLARISGGVPQWRQYLGGSSWSSWTTISGLTGADGQIAITNHRNGTQEQVHVAVIKGGDLWYNNKIGSSGWTGWQNLGHPSGASFNGGLAISNSDVRVIVGGASSGNVWVRLKFSTSWGSWVSLGGGNSLTGSLAISTRPNGMYHMVALRSDGIVFMQCSVNYAQWWGWSSIGGTMGGGLSIDNDSANGSCDVDAHNPGVHVVGIGNYIAYVRCWDPQCPQASYDPLGPSVGAPSAVSNSVNPFAGSSRWVDVAVRSGNDELHRYRVY